MARKVLSGPEKRARKARNDDKRNSGEILRDSIGRMIVEKFGGVQTTLTSALLEQIIESVRAGTFPHHAAMAHMVPWRTWNGWMSRGKRGEEPYAHAYHAVESAKAFAIQRASKRLAAVGENPRAWMADARFLESVGADSWMRTEKRTIDEGDAFKTMMDEMLQLKKSKQQQLSPHQVADAPALLEDAAKQRANADKKMLPIPMPPITQIPGSENKA